MRVLTNIKTENHGLLAAFLAIVGWSSAGIFINLLPELSAVSIVSFRLTVALIVSTLLLLLMKRNIFVYLKELNNFAVWGLGLILFFCYLLGTLAFQKAPVGEITLLMTTSPLFVMAYKIFFNESIKKVEFLGLFLAIFGILFITYPQLSTTTSNVIPERLIGDSFALIGSFLFATYAIWYRSLRKKDVAPNTISVALGTFIIGAMLFIVTVDEMLIVQKVSSNVSLLLGIGILSTAIPTVSYAVASKELKPLVSTSLLLLQPPLATLFALLILSEIPTIWTIPGLIFILIGLMLIVRSK